MEKIIVANYRYFVSGGPEVYMFKFMDNSQKIGYESIPFSVNYSKNIESTYDKYFISNRGGDSVYYDDIKKTPKTIIKILQGAFYNKEAYNNITKLINDEHPKVLYALQVINTLSPSIFKAAKKKGLKVIHRISDFNLVCPRSDLLLGDNVCDLCINGQFKNGIRNRCFHNSKLATIIRCISMKYHRRHKLYKYVDYFVTPTEFTKELLIRGGFNPNKIVCIPTFINAQNIKPNYTNNNYFLFLGRLSHEKGAIYAILAMKYILNFETKLVITGKLTDKDIEIKNIIKENNLENKIEFVGFKRDKELESLISNAICTVNPAIWYENMPNSIIEAYAYGKPVIASNIGCFKEIVEDGKTGLLFEPKNEIDLSNKMNYFLENPNATIDMGKAARKLVLDKYSPENHMNKLKKIFED